MPAAQFPRPHKIVTQDAAPHITAPMLSAIMATPVEFLTVEQLSQLQEAVTIAAKAQPINPGAMIGTLFE